jgi:hypothetical protein
MNIDSFLYHLILLIIPGLIGLTISRTLSSVSKRKKKIKEWYDLFLIITFTFMGCLIYDVISTIIALFIPSVNLGNTITILQSTKEYFTSTQFLCLIIINVVLGFISAWIYNKKILYKIGKKFLITKQYGEEDVWSFFNNADDVEWVFVRNFKNGLTYFGYIQLYSDSSEKRELLLSDASVYNTNTSTYLYSMNKIYLCLEDTDVSIEIPEKEDRNAGKTAETATFKATT